MMNTRVYDVMILDGAVQQYSVNVIAESLCENADDEGYRSQYLDEIMDHKKLKDAVPKSDGYLKIKNGQRRRRITSKGWEFQVRWKDGLQSWVPMIDLRESYPVELAEYVTLMKISDEPAFVWWVPFTLKKRDQIISAVKARVKKRTRKYGILVPRTVKEAYELDSSSGTTYWRDAVKKEMKNVVAAFKILESDEHLPVGYARMKVHMVFDIKPDFTRKARLVADGHLTPTLWVINHV